MPLTLFDLQKRDELTVDVYGDGSFLIRYLPRKLSKPMIQEVQRLANMEEMEYKMDSPTTFLHKLIPPDGWDLVEHEVDEDGNPVLDENGSGVPAIVRNEDGSPKLYNGEPIYKTVPVNKSTIENLGFYTMRDITRAINEHYGEFMNQGESTGAVSDSPSQAEADSSPTGTTFSGVETVTNAAPGNLKVIR